MELARPTTLVRLAAAALAALALALCAQAALAPGAEAARSKRIVALSPFAANALVEMGVKPVAIGQTLGGRDRFSRKLRRVRVLPLSHPYGPNLEQLAKLRPDLVLSTPQWRKGHAAMRRLKIRVVTTDPRSVAGVIGQSRLIGKLIGKPKAGERLARRLYREVDRERRNITHRPRVLMILGVGRTPFAFLRNSWGGDLVTRAGGRLITDGLKASGGFARISNEYVVAADPDVIIAVPHGNTKDIPAAREWLLTNPAWQDTRAVKEGRLYVSTDNSLLQPGTAVAKIIRRVRAWYLHNR